MSFQAVFSQFGAFLDRVFSGIGAGSGRLSSLAAPVFQAVLTAGLVWATLHVPGCAAPQPTPPPIPVPPLPPHPPTPPAPIPGDGLRVLMIYDDTKTAALTPGQLEAIYGAATRAYLQAHCATGQDGKTKEFRIWQSTTSPAGDEKVWQDAFARPHLELPWLVVSNGKGGYEGKLPGTIEETMKILKQWGGE